MLSCRRPILFLSASILITSFRSSRKSPERFRVVPLHFGCVANIRWVFPLHSSKFRLICAGSTRHLPLASCTYRQVLIGSVPMFHTFYCVYLRWFLAIASCAYLCFRLFAFIECLVFHLGVRLPVFQVGLIPIANEQVEFAEEFTDDENN